MKRLLAAIFVLVASLGFTHTQAQNLSVSPSTVTAGQSVTATWSSVASPTSTDWVGLYAAGAADNAFAAFVFTNGAAAGSVSLGVPVNLAAGTYELRLFTNNSFTRLATSGSLTVNAAPTATVASSPTSLLSGTTLSASWTNIVAPSSTDWVGLFAPGAANNGFVAWVYTSGTASGSVNLTVPVNLATGTYELRLFPNNSFTLLATSSAISITAPPPATVSASPSTVQSGASLTASWTNIVAPSATDWVGLFAPGAADNGFVTWISTTGAAAGSVNLAVPIPTVAGTYQLRLFSNGTFTRLATSSAVTVTAPPPATLSSTPSNVLAGGTVTAAWTNIVTPAGTDWIGMYTLGAADTAFVSWRYTSGTAAGNVPFTVGAIVANGTYELRLFSANSFTRIATSAHLTVGASQASLYFIHPDHLGTPRLVADDAGTAVWQWDQREPFGSDVPNQDPGNTGTAFEMPLRFPGQYADNETNLSYNYFRDYDPAIGRYRESDPVGLSGGINTFAYVLGDPLSRADYLGLVDLKIPGASGQVSVHGNPGPAATSFRPEHLPPHVHLGTNDGPRISTITFEPLTPKDALKMTPAQRSFCESLSAEQKSLIKKRSKAVYKLGAIKRVLLWGGIGITALTAETLSEFLEDSLSDLVPGGVSDVY